MKRFNLEGRLNGKKYRAMYGDGYINSIRVDGKLTWKTTETPDEFGRTERLFASGKAAAAVVRQLLTVARNADDAQSAFRMIGGASGTCGLCGRKLTDPQSRSRGIGPECWSQIEGAVRETEASIEVPA
jgi:hypothetical protein